MSPKTTRRPGSDAHYSVLADLLFSVLIATVTMMNKRVDVTEMCVIHDELPDADTSAASDESMAIFTLSAVGELQCNKTPLSMMAAREKLDQLKQEQPPRKIVLRVAPDCKHQPVAEFYKLCRDGELNLTEQSLIEEQENVSHE